MNRLVSILLLFLDEDAAFWGLVAIVESLMPSQYYDRTMIAAHADQVALLTYLSKCFSFILCVGFLSHWDPYAVISLEAVAYSSYCNTVEWFWWD